MNRVMQVLLTANNTNLTSVLAASSAQVQSFSRSAVAGNDAVAASATRSGTASKAMAAGLTVAAVAVGFAVTKAAEFDASMHDVNSLLKLNDEGFQGLSASVLDMATVLPQSANTLAEGLYDIASSGFDGAEGLTVLAASATAASAGLTTTEVAAKGITSVLNAYGLEASDAGDVSDILFKTVELGVVTFEELSTTLGDVVGTAAAAGIGIDQVGSALATMTLSGISASESGTSLNRLLQAIIDPSDELAQSLSELGYESGASALETDGLQVVMEKLRVQTGGNIEELLRLFPEIRAARGALALMSNEGQNYVRVSGEIEDADKRQGATKAALDEQMKSAAAQAQVFYNNIEVGAIKVGTLVLPILLALMDGVRNVGELLGQVGTAVAPAWDSLVQIFENLWQIAGTLAEAFGPVIGALLQIGGGIVIGALTAVAAALEAITGFLADNEAAAVALAIVIGSALVVSFVRAEVGALSAAAAMSSMSLVQFVGAISGVTSLAGAFTVLRAGAGSTAAIMTAASTAAKGFLAAATPIAAVAAPLLLIAGLVDIANNAQTAKDEVAALTANLDISDSGAVDETVASLEARAAAIEENIGKDDLFLAGLSDQDEQLDATRAEIDRLREASESYSSGLEETADRLGMTTDALIEFAAANDIDLSKLAEGEGAIAGIVFQVGQLQHLGAGSTDPMVQALEVLADGAATAEEKISAMKDALDGLIGGPLSESAAIRDYQQAIDDATAAGQEYTASVLGGGEALVVLNGQIVQNTQVGRDAAAAIEEVISAGVNQIQMMAENGASTDALAGAATDMYNRFLDVAAQFGITGQTAVDLAAKYGLVPDQVDTIVRAVGADTSAAQIADLQRQIDALTGKTVYVNTVQKTTYTTDGSVPYVPSGYTGKYARGGAVRFADGGALNALAMRRAETGLLARQSEYAPDGANLINWAEPGTGGELHIFVPLANDGRRESAKKYARMAVEELAMGPADLGWGASYANGGVRQPIPAMRGYAAMGAGTGSGAAPGGAALIAEVRALGARIDAMSDRPFLADLRVLLDGELMNRAMHRIDDRNVHR